MTLSEKLYRLRRKAGLSQEELAEKLDCSRQVISKWENGTTAPDAEKLKEISRLFGVSVDYLLKDEVEETTGTVPIEKAGSKRLVAVSGLVFSLLGCAGLILFALISVFGFGSADKIAASSTVVLNGTFLAMLCCMLLLVLGAMLLLSSMKRK